MTEDQIQPYLKTKRFGQTIYAFDTIDSTNTYAKLLTSGGCSEGTLVIAEEQSQGRGRAGRSWFSEKGNNLTFSIILKPKIKPDSIGIISLYASLAVAQSIENIAHLIPECKWPNDVLLDGKKVCGILSDGVFDNGQLSYAIVGIGINVNQTAFPDEIIKTATSLSLSTGKNYNRVEVLAVVIGQLEILYDKILLGQLGEILVSWKKYCSLFGKKITIDQQGAVVSGTVITIGDDGGLILQIDGIEKKIFAGDITILNS